jgi:hypothetical protein
MLHRVIVCVSKELNASIFSVKQFNKTRVGVLKREDRFRNIPAFEREENLFAPQERDR